MSYSTECCVDGCHQRKRFASIKTVFHRFPKSISLCQAQLRNVGNLELVQLPVKFLTHSRFVCSQHFDPNNYRGNSSRLKTGSIASIFPETVECLRDEDVEKYPLTECVGQSERVVDITEQDLRTEGGNAAMRQSSQSLNAEQNTLDETPEGSGPQLQLPSAPRVLSQLENLVLGWGGAAVPVGAGFINIGNTCYINSSLQALFHILSFGHWLVNDTDHKEKCAEQSGCLTCAMRGTLLQSWEQSILVPEMITSKLQMICESLTVGAQEDAHEFLRNLLQRLEEGFLKRFSPEIRDPLTKETTHINQILGGYMRIEVTCSLCKNVSITFKHFQEVMLDIRETSNLEEALNLFFSEEALPEPYRCEKCQGMSQASKKVRIEKAPKVMCIQLKRFLGVGHKITKHVEFDASLDLERYVDARHVPAMSSKYKLKSMVIHHGDSALEGHYTTVAETSPSTFHRFDDCNALGVTVVLCCMLLSCVLSGTAS